MVKIIAESASNHQGSYDYLMELAKASKYADADFFTVQILDIESFCDDTYPSKKIGDDVSFKQDQWRKFFQNCRDLEINLIPCAADLKSFKFCYDEGFRLFKLHGTDLLNIPMLEEMAKYEIKVLVETQLATERDIDLALSVLVKDRVEALIHGYSNYPTEEDELQINAIGYMKSKWNLPVGFADHSVETDVIPMMAISQGAEWIEKHITLSRNDRRYDWQPSLSPEEFKMMVSKIHYYQKALGHKFKHPTSTECAMREVMYKRYLEGSNGLRVVRATHGPNYYEHLYSSYDPNRIVTAVIARLKSTRLKRKVLLPFHNDTMIFDLISYVSKSKCAAKTILATSVVEEDTDLVKEAEDRKIETYRGDPLIVIDRLIDIAEKEKASYVFRVTGDMPFADPELMDIMAEMALKEQLDYVRVMNFPLGMSAELFSTSYLQKLYQRMENPLESEYLGWFVILDRKARKGCLEVKYKDIDLSLYSLTVDYQEDMDRCQKLLSKIGKKEMKDICLTDILKHLDVLGTVSPDMVIKLPNDTTMSYTEFVKMQWDQGFCVSRTYEANE